MKRTFNSLDEFRAFMQRQAEGDDPHAVTARATLAVMDDVSEWIESEKEKGTDPTWVINAIANMCANVMINAVLSTTPEEHCAETIEALAKCVDGNLRYVADGLESGETSDDPETRTEHLH